MAASNRCFTCEKAPGAYFCTGCKVYFCMKDSKNHHAQLVNELDVLVGDRNELQEKIEKATQQSPSGNNLLTQIDQWQKATVAKVEQAADRARQQVMTILKSKHAEITTAFDVFSKELVQMKETEELAHDDLTRFQQMIEDLNENVKQLKHPPSIELHTEQSDQINWNRMIYVEQNISRSENQQQQPKRSEG